MVETGHAGPVAMMRTPLVDLPLGATEDRVCGTIDFERALTEGGYDTEFLFDLRKQLVSPINFRYVHVRRLHVLDWCSTEIIQHQQLYLGRCQSL